MGGLFRGRQISVGQVSPRPAYCGRQMSTSAPSFVGQNPCGFDTSGYSIAYSLDRQVGSKYRL